jgi:hypothetical protein
MKQAVGGGGLRYHYIHTKFHEDWFRHSKDDRADTQTQRVDGCVSIEYCGVMDVTSAVYSKDTGFKSRPGLLIASRRIPR